MLTIPSLYHLASENISSLHGGVFCLRFVPYPWVWQVALASLPRCQNRFYSTLRTQYEHNCLGYIDDSFYTVDSDKACREANLHAAQVFTRVGFVIHPTKSVFHLAQCL